MSENSQHAMRDDQMDLLQALSYSSLKELNILKFSRRDCLERLIQRVLSHSSAADLSIIVRRTEGTILTPIAWSNDLAGKQLVAPARVTTDNKLSKFFDRRWRTTNETDQHVEETRPPANTLDRKFHADNGLKFWPHTGYAYRTLDTGAREGIFYDDLQREVPINITEHAHLYKFEDGKIQPDNALRDRLLRDDPNWEETLRKSPTIKELGSRFRMFGQWETVLGDKLPFQDGWSFPLTKPGAEDEKFWGFVTFFSSRKNHFDDPPTEIFIKELARHFLDIAHVVATLQDISEDYDKKNAIRKTKLAKDYDDLNMLKEAGEVYWDLGDFNTAAELFGRHCDYLDNQHRNRPEWKKPEHWEQDIDWRLEYLESACKLLLCETRTETGNYELGQDFRTEELILPNENFKPSPYSNPHETHSIDCWNSFFTSHYFGVWRKLRQFLRLPGWNRKLSIQNTAYTDDDFNKATEDCFEIDRRIKFQLEQTMHELSLQGSYEIADRIYLLLMHHRRRTMLPSNKNFFQKLSNCIYRNFLLRFWFWISGYGTSPLRLVKGVVVTVLLFATLYFFMSRGSSPWLFDNTNMHFVDFGTSIVSAISFSVTVFTTLGFGDIVPVHPIAMFLVMLQVFTGYAFLAATITVILRKLMPRF